MQSARRTHRNPPNVRIRLMPATLIFLTFNIQSLAYSEINKPFSAHPQQHPNRDTDLPKEPHTPYPKQNKTMSVPESATAAAKAAALTQHHPAVTRNLERISKRSKPAPLSILPSSPDYPAHYTRLADRIRTALGNDRLLFIQHTGSTSIPGMPAKPIIDIDVVVADPTDEAAYVSALVGEGWETTGTGKGTGERKGEQQKQKEGAGLQFMLREPGWHEHRFFVYDESEPVANVHVFGPGCPEVVRHQIFREWLLAVSRNLLFPFLTSVYQVPSLDSNGVTNMLSGREREREVGREV